MTDTQAIKDRIDIVQLIGEYVPLKKAGVHWKANCPFHHEKSPSFMVNPEKQIWHCFGCGKGGDIFSFIQEMEGLDFPEALKLLAQRAGVTIDTFQSEINQSQRNRLLEINSTAAYFFHEFLLTMAAAKPARDYLDVRQLKPQTINDWQVGYITDQWDLLTKYLLKKGFGIADLVASGLTIQRDGATAESGRGFYDRFRGRIMFPIGDAHGNIVGFTGRVLFETEHSGGKYVNTPQTLLYDKSRVLYGIHKAKQEIKAKDLAILVEGQMDVIACHQAGLTNVVAASGTALTESQIKLLKRYTNNVAMAFDADAAGESAGKRGADVALAAGMNVKIIQIPKGFAKDADECIKKDPKVWFKAVADARGVLDWYFEKVLGKINRHNPEEKQRAANLLLAEIARVPFGVVRDEWMKKLGEELSIDPAVLRDEYKRLGKQNARMPGHAQTALGSEPTKNLATPALPPTRSDVLIREFWSVLLKFPEHYSELATRLKKERFLNSQFLNLYENAERVYNNHQKLDLEAMRRLEGENNGENTVDLLLLRPNKDFAELSTSDAKAELADLLERINSEWRKLRGQELQKKIADAEKIGDKMAVEELIKELQSI